MIEQACEEEDKCNVDEFSFKAYFSSWLAATTVLVPSTTDAIIPLLTTSATAAGLQCDGGTSGTACGFDWPRKSNYDGTTGVGQQMSALGVIQAAIIAVPGEKPLVPVTNRTGGTSVGDPSAGNTNSNPSGTVDTNSVVTLGDKVAASFLTVGLIGGVIGGSVFLII